MRKSVRAIPLSKVTPGQSVANDRQYFDPRKIEELAVSIAKNGLVEPIKVRPQGDRFEVVAGERRFRAHLHLNQYGAYEGDVEIIAPGQVTTIDAIVEDMDDERASQIMLTENTSREDLNPMEEAAAYQTRISQYGKTPEQLAQEAGVSPEVVIRRLSLLSLIPDIQHLVRFGNLPLGHAELLTPLDPDRQRSAVTVFNSAKNGMSHRQLKRVVDELLEAQNQQTLFDIEQFWVEQVQKEAPRRGKNAVINAPTSKELPEVWRDTGASASEIMDRYIADLLAAGFKREAAAVGNLLTVLVRHNYMAVPLESAIPDGFEDGDQ